MADKKRKKDQLADFEPEDRDGSLIVDERHAVLHRNAHKVTKARFQAKTPYDNMTGQNGTAQEPSNRPMVFPNGL